MPFIGETPELTGHQRAFDGVARRSRPDDTHHLMEHESPQLRDDIGMRYPMTWEQG